MNKDEFKEAFGIKQSSTDWTKILDLLQKKWSEANNFVNSKVLQGNDQTSAENDLAQILTRLRQVNSVASDDKPTAGRTARDDLLPDIQDFLDTYRKTAKTTPLTVTVGNDDVTLYWTDIPGYERMDANARQNAAQQAAQKVARGNQVFDAIKNWDGTGQPPQASHDDAGALIWALKSKAQEKNSPYIKGAMVAPDGEKVRKYLDSLGGPNGEVYPRSSSHLTDQQKLTGQQARGMDFYGDNDDDPGKLPAGMKTLLYQQVTLPSGAKAIYLKMETAAAFGTAKFNFFNGVTGNDTTMPVGRNRRPDDKAHADEHGDNYMSGKKEMDRELGAKREQVPKEITTAWNTYLKTVNTKTTKAALKSASGSPVRLNKILMKLEELARAGTIDPQTDGNLRTFLDVVEKSGSIDRVSDLDSRFGGEAVLTPDDFP
ncbi:MAG: hypothetical protein KGI51_04040 [Rhodospirillales bacterium]|nr:hypothetical protein [Rhodospirillales bacterium]